MKLKTLFAIIGLTLFCVGCTDTSHYPVSGEECGPEDPVKDFSSQQCAKAA